MKRWQRNSGTGCVKVVPILESADKMTDDGSERRRSAAADLRPLEVVMMVGGSMEELASDEVVVTTVASANLGLELPEAYPLAAKAEPGSMRSSSPSKRSSSNSSDGCESGDDHVKTGAEARRSGTLPVRAFMKLFMSWSEDAMEKIGACNDDIILDGLNEAEIKGGSIKSQEMVGSIELKVL